MCLFLASSLKKTRLGASQRTAWCSRSFFSPDRYRGRKKKKKRRGTFPSPARRRVYTQHLNWNLTTGSLSLYTQYDLRVKEEEEEGSLAARFFLTSPFPIQVECVIRSIHTLERKPDCCCCWEGGNKKSKKKKKRSQGKYTQGTLPHRCGNEDNVKWSKLIIKCKPLDFSDILYPHTRYNIMSIKSRH